MRYPYKDPNTQICYGTDDPDFEGWLSKKSTWMKDWRRRYFLLKNSRLFFSESPYSPPHGMIDLSNCTGVNIPKPKSTKRANSFQITTPEIKYLLFADTEGEKHDWMCLIERAISTCSRLYLKEQSCVDFGNNCDGWSYIEVVSEVINTPTNRLSYSILRYLEEKHINH